VKKIIVIIGTTSSSKTSLAIKLAKDLGGEIINGDAFQVYKEIAIGTSKVIDTQEIKFHLNGTVSIYDE
jgi:tRNA dimethylallyltransferase